MRRKHWFIINAIIALIAFYFLYVFEWNKTINPHDNWRSVKINGSVMGIYNNRGDVFIKLSDNTRYVLPISYNYDYKKNSIDDFIHNGDSISKESNNDTLWVYRDNEVYYFKIGNISK